ncbi:MAG TPA: pitrilysin family protein [Gemmatimonadaceae bacterium]|nr:pitrilysin family protein [Gemmatimonadaceae bacterium]
MRYPHAPTLARSVAALALAACVLNANATAQQIPRIQFTKFSLPNGLEVIVHEDHSTPIVAVDTWYHVGSASEKPGRTGFAHLFEHVMFMGSKNVPQGTFDKLLESSGADNNGSTTEDRTNYYETGPSNMLPLALWLDADRMGWLLPTMDQAKLDAQRGVVKEERNQRVDNVPYGKASETISAALYPKTHPYSWPVVGSMADLSAASLTDVQEFFKLYYAPNNATLVVAGDVKTDSVKALVTKYFGDVPRNPNIAPHPAPQLVSRATDTVLVLEDRVQLPRIYYVWPTVQGFHADEAPLDHFAAILGGGRTSRLYRKLVYEMQIASDVLATHPTGNLSGTFEIVATPAPGHTPAEVAKVIDDELKNVLAAGVTDAELARARNSRRASFLNGLSSILGKAEQLQLYNDQVKNPDYVQQDAARYEKVTRADIQRVANQYLSKGKVVLTVVPQGKKDLALTGGGK